MSPSAGLTIQTADPQQLARFYTALGFTETSRDDQTITLHHAGFELHLIRPHAAAPTIGTSQQLTMRVDSATELLAKLDAAGGRTEAQPNVAGTAVVLDPDGHRIRILTAALPSSTSAGQNPVASGPAADERETIDSAADSAQLPADTADHAPAPTAPPTTPAADPTPASTRHVPPADTALPQSTLPASYYTDDGVPTFDAVAERIQQRTATADGNAVLDADSERGAAEVDSMDKLKKAGKDRLDQLRKSMGL